MVFLNLVAGAKLVLDNEDSPHYNKYWAAHKFPQYFHDIAKHSKMAQNMPDWRGFHLGNKFLDARKRILKNQPKWNLEDKGTFRCDEEAPAI